MRTVLERHFEMTSLSFENQVFENVFSSKNNKTLEETLAHRRYTSLKAFAERNYVKQLTMPLGDFLLDLKQSDDNFYKEFLNKYGDESYSRFELSSPQDFMKKGVYFFSLDDIIVYVGRCKDSMKNRINSGYGKIHPKNCYKDGQSTNCRLNSLITKEKGNVSEVSAHGTDLGLG